MERIKNFFKDESGASAVEYGLLVALIAVVIIAGGYSSGDQPQCARLTAATTQRWQRLSRPDRPVWQVGLLRSCHQATRGPGADLAGPNFA